MVVKRSYSMGSGGYCFCPKCGYKTAHQPGQRCQEQRCPECDVKLIREGSYHHDLLKKKKQD